MLQVGDRAPPELIDKVSAILDIISGCELLEMQTVLTVAVTLLMLSTSQDEAMFRSQARGFYEALIEQAGNSGLHDWARSSLSVRLPH